MTAPEAGWTVTYVEARHGGLWMAERTGCWRPIITFTRRGLHARMRRYERRERKAAAMTARLRGETK